MNERRIAVVTTILVVAVCAGGWMFLPALRDARQRVDADASYHLERARRLLHQYSPTQAYNTIIVDQLRDADIDVDAKDAAALAESNGELYQATHTAFWTSFEPREWNQTPPRGVRPSYGNLPAQMREGITARNRLSAENQKLLKDAMSELDAALTVENGDASGRNHAEVNRLRGVLFFHQAEAQRMRAALKRAEAEPYRRQLASLAATTVNLTSAKSLLEKSGIDRQVEAVQQKLESVRTENEKDRKSLAELDGKIKDMEKRLAEARRRIDAARGATEKIVDAGVDFATPNGAAEFESKLTAQSEISQTAQREAHMLETGGLPKAEIDASGDFLKGRYMEGNSATDLTPEFGLTHYRTERAALAAAVERGGQSVSDFESDLARLEGMRKSYQSTQDDAEKQLAECAKSAEETYTDLNRIESEIEVIEDAALKLFDQSASTFQQAAGFNDQWVSDAREHTSSLSPEAKDRSAWGKREGDSWIGAFISAHVADARLAKAWIDLDRFAAHAQTANILAAIAEPLNLKEADPAVEQEKAAQAKAAGLEEINKAVGVLEKAHRSGDRNWTFVAQAAVANDLLSLFGEKEYVAEAVDTYRTALKGRENDASNVSLAARLKRLEGEPR